MEITEIKINVENHSDFDISHYHYGTWSIKWQESLAANFDVNNFLESQLGGNFDWGGKYATLLDSIGIESNSENGWWSKSAVMHENILAFVKYQKEDEYHDLLSDAKQRYLSYGGKVKHDCNTIDEFIEVFHSPII